MKIITKKRWGRVGSRNGKVQTLEWFISFVKTVVTTFGFWPRAKMSNDLDNVIVSTKANTMVDIRLVSCIYTCETFQVKSHATVAHYFMCLPWLPWMMRLEIIVFQIFNNLLIFTAVKLVNLRPYILIFFMDFMAPKPVKFWFYYCKIGKISKNRKKVAKICKIGKW